MTPEADEQHRDQQDRDRRADTEVIRDEAAQPMGQAVVVATLPDVAEELNRGPQLSGAADKPRDQDVQREQAADRDLGAHDVATVRGLRGQRRRQRLEPGGQDGEQRAHRLKSRPEPSRVRMTTKRTAKAAGTITAGRSKGLRSGPRSMKGSASNSKTPPVGSTSTRGISCCGTRTRSSSRGRKNHSGTGV